jgi:hypothetical protein
MTGITEENTMLSGERLLTVHALAKEARELDGDLEIIFHYNGDPVLYPGVGRRVAVSLRQPDGAVDGEIEVRAPEGWQVAPVGPGAFDLTAAEPDDVNRVEVQARVGGSEHAASFVFFGPGGTNGFPASVNVERCPVCSGRKGTCICTRSGR